MSIEVNEINNERNKIIEDTFKELEINGDNFKGNNLELEKMIFENIKKSPIIFPAIREWGPRFKNDFNFNLFLSHLLGGILVGNDKKNRI